MEKVLITVATKKVDVLLRSVVFLMALKNFTLTTKVHLIRVNTRNTVVWTSKNSPALFQVNSHEANFRFFKGSTDVSSKLGSVNALKQNTEIASEELSSGMEFSKINVFSGLFLKSLVFFHIKSHQKKSILDFLDAEKRFEE